MMERNDHQKEQVARFREKGREQWLSHRDDVPAAFPASKMDLSTPAPATAYRPASPASSFFGVVSQSSPMNVSTDDLGHFPTRAFEKKVSAIC